MRDHGSVRISMAPNAVLHWQSALDHLAETSAFWWTDSSRILNDRTYAESGVTFEDLRSPGEQSLAAMIDALRSAGTETVGLESLADQLGAAGTDKA
ncbi:hypothetical protein SAMN05660916_02394 [Arthrobacter sp. 31Cvi3.1E]|nr:hypothetical protein SAMN05660916_02394 [Arthrobacter sp. 31Cvi3.1E]